MHPLLLEQAKSNPRLGAVLAYLQLREYEAILQEETNRRLALVLVYLRLLEAQ